MSIAVQAISGLNLASALAPSTSGVADALFILRKNPSAKVTITDTADQIARHFDALSRWSGNITSVSVSDLGNATPGLVKVSASQFSQNARLIAKFSDSGVFVVDRSSAAYASTLQSSTKVASFSVKDSSTEIGNRGGIICEGTRLHAPLEPV